MSRRSSSRRLSKTCCERYRVVAVVQLAVLYYENLCWLDAREPENLSETTLCNIKVVIS